MNTTFWRLFNLRRDQDDPDVIDAEIRDGTHPVGANLWVLFFAILIASVGLNVNSTAVIVGAMLVSPLMGPILGIGYGAAVHDVPLIREAARTLGVFTAISLITSTLYFAISPLDQPGSELLARTTPTLWDVLIAAFGGAAGMIAATRKEVTNVVPGVAIATALMPPLCTAGFGLAHGRWDMFGGAAYLFIINSVFIAASTLAISKLLRLPRRGHVDPTIRHLHRIAIALGITVVLAPSVLLGYQFVQHEVFQRGASRVAEQIVDDPTYNVVSYQVDTEKRSLRLTLVGGYDSDKLEQVVKALMQREGLAGAALELRRAGDVPLDLGQLRNQVKADVDRTVLQQLQAADARMKALESDVQGVRKEVEQSRSQAPVLDAAGLRQEVQAQLPQVLGLTLAFGTRAEDTAEKTDAAVVVVETRQPLTAAQRTTLRRWLQVRLDRPAVQLLEQSAPAPRDSRRS